MSFNIVTVNVTQLQAPTPSKLQGTGAFISQGATTLTPSTIGPAGLLTQLSDLTPLLKGALALASITWTTNVATATTAAPHGFTTSDTIELTIAGATSATYNGTYLCTITGASTFTYPLLSNPGGAASVPGTYTPEDVAELLAMATTFFAQGSQVSIYVLELGAGNPTDGTATLTTWLNSNPETVYSFLVPRTWDNNTAFKSLIASYEATTAKTYFWVTTTTGTYTNYTALMKCVNALIEAPGIPALEFSQAALFWKSLSYDPSSTNKVAPFGYSFLFGVTPYPVSGNSSLLSTLKSANINIIGTGSEGGVSNTLIFWGNMLDGRPFNYWYSVDWMQININLNISNAVINGSNDPLNPLYLNQQGITALEGVGAATLVTAITVGLALGQVVQTALDGPSYAAALGAGTFAGKAAINAVPFPAYYTINPGDYKIGKYAGFSISYTPLRGFDSITFNIVVTDFVAA